MKHLTLQTRIFLILIYIIGFAIFAYYLRMLDVEYSLTLSVLSVTGAILHILKVEGSTNRSHYTLSFIVFGFTLVHLGIPGALLVILVSNLAEWVWNRPAWFIQLFNICCYGISIAVGGILFSAINPDTLLNSWPAILAIVIGMTGYTFANHFLVGVILWLARGENFKQSGVFGPTPVLIDLTMMSVGASMQIVWQFNPFALLIFLLPSYPFYMSLKIPGLERKSETDLKTGLYNHHYFMMQFSNELQRANRYDRPLSIIMADLDLLRNINNTYGHLAGDEVLKEVADILKKTVREYDLVARFGGEEFAILMPEADIEKAIERAEYIRKAIESAKFIVPTSVDPIKVTMSFGISKRENFGESVTEIIHHADTALYRSKLSGRNACIAYFNNSFVGSELSKSFKEPHQLVQDVPPPAEQDAGYQAAATEILRKPVRDPEAEPTGPVAEPVQSPNESAAPPSSRKKVQSFVALLTLGAFAGLLFVFKLYAGEISLYSSSEWLGLLVIAITIIITEWYSINLYVRNTSLSTSAVPIIVLVILFGPIGTLVASLVFSLTAALKYRSQFSRILFNFSNHLLAGTVINLLFHFNAPLLTGTISPLVELGITLVSSQILFFLTTAMISVGVGIDVRQSPKEIWKEQYQWMVPYYIGLGFIAYALIFGYNLAHVPGILTLLIPIALLRIGQAQYVEHTRAVVSELRQKNLQLERSSTEINELNEGLLMTLSDIIDLRDPYVLGHSRMVSNHAADIAANMKLSSRQTEMIRKAGLLHDIGKLGIPAAILAKPASLTSEEYAIVKDHAALGGDLVKNSPSLRPLVPFIRHHHEHFNGKGYPDKLAGSKIPIEARILAVADAIEAMSSDRPYRKALAKELVIKELLEHAGTQFDPLVVESAIKMLEAKTPEKETGAIKTETQVRLSERFALQG